MTEDYFCGFVDLHEIEGTKLHAKLTSDCPDGVNYQAKKDQVKIVKIITPDNGTGCYLYDATDEYADHYLESWIRKYARTNGIAQTLAEKLLDK